MFSNTFWEKSKTSMDPWLRTPGLGGHGVVMAKLNFSNNFSDINVTHTASNTNPGPIQH